MKSLKSLLVFVASLVTALFGFTRRNSAKATAFAVLLIAAASTAHAQAISSEATAVSQLEGYAADLGTVFFAVFTIAAGVGITVLLWRYLKKGAK